MAATVDWLILCHDTDGAALWAARGLRERLTGTVEVVTPELLAFAASAEHRFGADRDVIRIALADGRTIDGDHLRGVVNRLVEPWVGHWKTYGPDDADYVFAEVTAFHLGWLAGLVVPVLNPPDPSSLAGRYVRRGELSAIATGLGIRTNAVTRSTREGGYGAPASPPAVGLSVVAVDGQPFGPAAADLADTCARISDALGTRLLGLTFVANAGGELVLRDVVPMPDLRIGGAPLLDRLADCLGGAA